MTIKFWGATNPNGYLSNFYDAPFTVNGITYSTVEHFFQSIKFQGTKWEFYIRLLATPALAAKEGKRRDLPLRTDWDQIKEEVMYFAIGHKFRQNLPLMKKLVATGNSELIENSPYDSYWGVGKNGTGQNRLGFLLMKLREELR